MDLAEKIKVEREKRGIKQVDMANALNLERSNYTRMENRGSKMTLDQIQGIAEVIGISVQDLMGIEFTKSEEKNDNGEKEEKDKKIESLKKRIAELEDRVKDKESIVSFHANKLTQYLPLIETTINQYTRSKAREYGLMTYIEIVKEEENKLPLKLKGKSAEVISFFERKGITHFQGHIIDKFDMRDTIELAFENEFYVAESIYKLAVLANINSELLETWEQVYNRLLHLIARPDIDRHIIKAKVNNKLIDVSGSSQKVVK